MAENRFNPHAYKSYDDLPVDEQKNFKPTEGGGFVRNTAIEDEEKAIGESLETLSMSRVAQFSSLARIIESRDSNPDLGMFDEKIKEKILDMASEIINGVQDAVGKKLNWTLEFSKPYSEAALNKLRHKILDDEPRPIKESEIEAMGEAGLSLGSVSSTKEDDDKGVYFLADRILAKQGLLKVYTEGSANLNLNRKTQVEITTDGYYPKFKGKMEMQDVIKYLQEQL